MKLARVAEYILVLIGVWLLGYWSGEVLTARVYQLIEGHNLSRALHAQATVDGAVPVEPSPEQPTSHEWADGAVIGRLAIPRLALSTVVVEGAGDRELELAAGHIRGTAWPGEKGNAAIAGHRDTFFRPLRLVRKGDEITVTTLTGEYEYRVVSTEIVEPDDVQVLYPTKAETLTLVTCYPFYFVGPAPKRFIIRAERLPSVTKEMRELTSR